MWDLEYAPTTSDWIINAINILGYISSGCSTSFFEKMLYFMHTSSRFIIFCCCCCFWTFLWLCGLVLKSIGIRTWLEIRRFFFHLSILIELWLTSNDIVPWKMPKTAISWMNETLYWWKANPVILNDLNRYWIVYLKTFRFNISSLYYILASMPSMIVWFSYLYVNLDDNYMMLISLTRTHTLPSVFARILSFQS